MSAEPFESRLKRLEEDVRRLMRVVIEGNGHDPLLVRVVKLEDALKSQTAILRWILGVVSGTGVIVLGAAAVWMARRIMGL